eukprot:CAMPEP_0195511354 /NCGR_PEP_ID=MMETSP0794_2-20130614/3705_1 /TAXON_ID=515487 /ORGANISM="Stephanopyxis turris, Strain CCMP 815" /LENGTH=99 /DNA_ID=CAMNT_0040638931 /DNA_START=109 /DNA_END=408 /DNA_ORIENTATION=+
MSAAEFVKSEIDSNEVIIFSKSYCPYCKKTKKLFNEMNVDAKAIELDKIADGAAIQNALASISGQRTVPNVYIKGTHLGGNDDTQAAKKNGKLAELLGK